MKRYNLIILAIALLAMTSCNKEKIVQEEATGAITNERDAFTIKNESMLNTVALGLLDIARDKNFRAEVYQEVGKQFDGDDNVLLKTLQEKRDLRTVFSQSLSNNRIVDHKVTSQIGYEYGFYETTDQLEKAINGFVMDDEVWFSQIYIPFAENINADELPTIVVGTEDSEDCVALGYKLLKNNGFDIIEVDESYAKEHLVWVVSVNEVVNNEGIIEEEMIPNRNPNNARNPEIFASTSSFKISDKKECWLCGKAEVSLRWTNINLAGSGCSNNIFHSRILLGKVGNSSLNDWINSTCALVYISNGATSSLDPNEHILLIMYEYDKNKKEKEVIFNPCYHSYYYRSKQSHYMALGVNDLKYSDFVNPPNATFPLTWAYLQKQSGNEYLKIRYRYH